MVGIELSNTHRCSHLNKTKTICTYFTEERSFIMSGIAISLQDDLNKHVYFILSSFGVIFRLLFVTEIVTLDHPCVTLQWPICSD